MRDPLKEAAEKLWEDWKEDVKQRRQRELNNPPSMQQRQRRRLVIMAWVYAAMVVGSLIVSWLAKK